MTINIANRVHETTTTSGTGTLNLGGATDGHRIFVAGIGDGNECYYCIADDNDWEVGIGTVTNATPDTLSRDTLLSSSTGSKIDWPGSGTRDVFCVAPAEALQDLTDSDLGAGVVVQDAARSFSRREIIGGDGITATNGTGAAGDITLAFTDGDPLTAAHGGSGHASYTKGDVLAASAATTLAKLGVGADRKALVADSGEATGLVYAFPAFTCTTKSGAYTVTNADGNTFFRLTAVAALTLPASPDADLQIGVTNDIAAGGTVTVAGNGKNIHGQASIGVTSRYASMLFIYDATAGEWKMMSNWPSPGYTYSNIQFFSAAGSGEWTVPNGYYRYLVRVMGAGGGGGSGGAAFSPSDGAGGAGGAGGGGYAVSEIDASPGTVYDYTVGAGGAGGVGVASKSNGNNGTTGGTSSWAPDGGAAIITCVGGALGTAGFAGTGGSGTAGSGGAGGTASGGDTNKTGLAGGNGATGSYHSGNAAAGGGGGGGAAEGEQNGNATAGTAGTATTAGSWSVGGAGGTGSGSAAGGAGGASEGAAGAVGTNAGSTDKESGGGGGGGAGSQSGVSGAGGAGGTPGSGGGGSGGNHSSSSASGNGGAGVDGLIVVEW